MVETKKRKVRKEDWDKVEKFVNGELDARRTSKYRKDHETIWKEVDRQIAMKPLTRFLASGAVAPMDWHHAIELGELANASEIIASDVMRIMFPQDRFWFLPHIEMEWPVGQNGRKQVNDKKQNIADGLLRSLMSQQHKDFGFKGRFRLSVKEALHHGSFVSEVRFEKELMVKDGDKVKVVGAPIWVPYSMWNAYPDPSPSVIGTGLFYTGSMILVEFMPLWKLKKIAKGDGWLHDRLKLVKKQTNKNNEEDTEDVELVKWKGDISIDRSDGDIFLPNSEVIIANGKLVFWGENKLPFPNVILGGYERQDVRDPYYTSPIIKQSPTHKMTTIVANKFLDATALKVEPPIEYDSNDPDYAATDGPVIAPGHKTGTRSMGQGMKSLDIGDPSFALNAFQLGVQQMKEGLGVSSNRAGVRDTDRETATAATLANQGAEVRTMEFISQLEPQGLLPFLYMQHELNRMHLSEYTFYNDEMHTPDFIRASKKDIKANVHFEVVGSRGILGEQQRAKRIGETTAFFSSNPMFAPKLKVEEIMLEMYRDAGKKNPEEWLKVEEKPQIPPEVLAQVQQMQQQGQQMQQMIAQLQQQLKEAQSGVQIKMADLELKREKSRADIAEKQARLAMDKANALSERKDNHLELMKNIALAQDQLDLEREQMEKTFSLKIAEMKQDFVTSMAKLK